MPYKYSACIFKFLFYNILFYFKMEKLNNLIKAFLKDREFTCKSQLTILYYEKYLTRFFKYTNLSLMDLWNRCKFRDWFSSIINRNISDETCRKYLKIIRLFSDFLIEEWIISINEARKLKFRVNNSNKDNIHIFEKSEIIDIFHFIDDYWGLLWDQYLYDRNRLIVFIFLFTGIRRAELVDILVSDCCKWYIFIRNWKWSKSRIVDIPSWLYDKIFDYINKYAITGYLIQTKTQTQLKPRAINSIFQKISKHLNIHIHSHKFRHTYATNCLDWGIPLNVIQDNLGHSSINTTAIYISVSRETKKKHIAKIPNQYIFC